MSETCKYYISSIGKTLLGIAVVIGLAIGLLYLLALGIFYFEKQEADWKPHKPDDVKIFSITKSNHSDILGLGTDGKVYSWNKFHNIWLLSTYATQHKKEDNK